MNKIKYLLATGGASAVLVLGLAAPVAADAGQIGGLGDNNSQSQTNTEDSPSNNDGNQANNGGLVQEVSGDCSAAFVSDIDQDQDNNTLQVNANVPIDVDANVGIGDDNNTNNQSTGSSSSSSSQSNSVSNSQSNSGPSFEADCSQENVTNVTKVVQASAKAQVSAPKGGVSAGAGEATSLQSLLGLFGSLGTTGFGLGLRFLKRG